MQQPVALGKGESDVNFGGTVSAPRRSHRGRHQGAFTTPSSSC